MKEKMSEYARRKAERESEIENRLLETMQHNVAVLKYKRLQGVHNSTFNESNSIVLCNNNPIIAESKEFLADLIEQLRRPEVRFLLGPNTCPALG